MDIGIENIAQDIIDYSINEIEKGVPYQNINSAIHGVLMEIQQYLMEYMSGKKEKKK